ncbi:5 -nucleotidase [Chlorella sorokiniana]|uniref:5-nucleotidase n=1 Tax=Chlorella sorokiniana TaxID=3076 RepID=A0A2P6TWC8_CHLSO|nr:5 -nucleotidase [Chlorella sorokiniana]|eukprot:PRW58362.1 5 -nucleotidase [Chlorella sorokiniana]
MSAVPRVLISNDDGITAPGLTALAAAIRADGFCTFVVSAPAGERSAQSHSISVGKHLHAWELPVAGAEEAWAVDGTPADSTMLALYGPLLRNRTFNLVVSGINRGDNCGLHLHYSGTVGAAREAACKDVPALAVSLDNYAARSEEQYAAAAAYTVAIMKAVLGVLPSPLQLAPGPSLAARLAGHVINLNVPKAEAVVDIQGYQLAWQGQHCHFPDWQELAADDHVKEGHAGAVTLRAFRNAAGSLRSDASEGCDSAAVQQGWVAVTPIGLRSDVPITAEAAQQRLQPALLQAVAAAMQAAAASLGVGVRGVPAELLATAEPEAAAATGLQPEAVAVGSAV